ncbi:MAG: glycosyltransferase family 39 protein [Chloroflexi bacterium]|nr:glycosyltransferase family 39 protein [Chloroflexota bacterium]
MLTSTLRSEKFRTLFTLFVFAVAIRMLFLIVLTNNNAIETGRDAQGYFNRAMGFESILQSLLTGHSPALADLAKAYTSNWPPLPAFGLGVGFLLFGHSLFAARLIVVILSALTTPLVYLVTEKFADKKSALFAAVIFAVYPSFVHFSLRLYSETTFIFFIFLTFLWLGLTWQAKSVRQSVIFAAITGGLLGLTILARAIALVWIPVIGLAGGLGAIKFQRRLLAMGMVLAATIVTLIPWELTLFAVEGRVILVTRTADLSLYLGDYFKPQTPLLAKTGFGSTTVVPQLDNSDEDEKPRVENFVDVPKPVLQWARTVNADFTLYRYFLMLGYPPLSPTVVGLILAVTFIAFALFLIFAIWGLLIPAPVMRYRWLILALIALTMALYAVTHGQSRYAMSLLALLLPAAGHGLANIKSLFADTHRRWAVVAAVCTLVIGSLTAVGLPHEYSTVAASSYYVNLVRSIDAVLHQNTTVSDRLVLRAVGGGFLHPVNVSIVDDDYVFIDSADRSLNWEPLSNSSQLELAVQSETAVAPLQLRLSTRPTQAVVIDLRTAAWHVWRPTGIPGIEYLWLGSGAYRQTDLDDETPHF